MMCPEALTQQGEPLSKSKKSSQHDDWDIDFLPTVADVFSMTVASISMYS